MRQNVQAVILWPFMWCSFDLDFSTSRHQNEAKKYRHHKDIN
jgi:hypothetical protein